MAKEFIDAVIFIFVGLSPSFGKRIFQGTSLADCCRTLLFCSELSKAIVYTAVGKKTEVFYKIGV